MAVHIPTPVLDEGPALAMSALIGAYVGRLFTLSGNTTTSYVKYFSLWPDLMMGIFVLSLIGWWRRSSAKDKKQNETQAKDEVRDRKIDEMHTAIVASRPEFVVANKDDVLRHVGSSVQIGAGGTFAMAVGAGPVKVTVPSGGLFGPDSPEEFEFTLDDQEHTLTLPLGGVVTAVSTVKGELSIGKGEDGPKH
jgi:hypothetical protein